MKRIARLIPWQLVAVLVVALFPLLLTFKNISVGLVDWRDYPFIVWVMEQNVRSIVSLDFAGLANTNGYYPFDGTKYLSDLLIPQSILMLPLGLLTNNLILKFNLVFALTIFLNIITTYYFWFSIFKDRKIAAIGSFLTSFSPFFHSNINHFQMITFWPFFAALFFLFKEREKAKTYVYVGVLLAVQFLASAYLGVFLAFVVLAFALSQSLTNKNLSFIKYFGIAILIFLAIDGVFIKGYIDAKSQFEIVRGYTEYIFYSAHAADYLFPKAINSIVYRLPLFGNWNALSGHFGEAAQFPGFSVLLLAVVALIKNQKDKGFFVGIKFGKSELFFVTLILAGFLFSLGPRLQFNGNYDHLPLPYHFVVKYLPLVNSVRTPGRWSFIFYIGLIYFALKAMSKIKSKFLFTAIAVFMLFEYLPISIPSEVQSYVDQNDHVLVNECQKDNLVALQIPVTHFDVKGGIVEGLSYITKEELASLYHGCRFVNGYSGYDLPHIQGIKNGLYESLNVYNPELFYETIVNSQAELIVINRQHILLELEENLLPTLSLLVNEGKLEQISQWIYKVNK